VTSPSNSIFIAVYYLMHCCASCTAKTRTSASALQRKYAAIKPRNSVVTL
jgi:hypothetical protein